MNYADLVEHPQEMLEAIHLVVTGAAGQPHLPLGAVDPSVLSHHSKAGE